MEQIVRATVKTTCRLCAVQRNTGWMILYCFGYPTNIVEAEARTSGYGGKGNFSLVGVRRVSTTCPRTFLSSVLKVT